VPSGIAAIISALIPVWIAAFMWIRFSRHISVRLLLGTACGLAGVVALSLTPGEDRSAHIEWLGLAALLFGTFAWAAGTIWSQRLPLPSSKPMAASIQMMVGGLALTLLSIGVGEARAFHWSRLTGSVVFYMFYLIVGASILAFTAYVWLLAHEPAARVASYAYVNPVIAVLLGWSLGGERLSMQIVMGMLLVLAGVVSVLGERTADAAR
jgi:drug/metabolite transporter (DMT)-like permease